MNAFFKKFLRSFMQGLLIIGPIAATAYVLYLIFISIDSLIPGLAIFPGIGFISVILIIAVVGFLGTRFFFGRWIVEAFGILLEHMPGVKHVYSAFKDVLDSFMGDKKKFNNPVWVRVNDAPEIWRIGFLTQKVMPEVDQEGKCAVYLPHSYAISGWVIIADMVDVKPVTGMNATEAMKFAVSGGVAGSVGVTV